MTTKKKTIKKKVVKAKASSRVVVNVNSHNKRPVNKTNTNTKQPQFIPVMVSSQVPVAPIDTRHIDEIKKRLDGIDTKMKVQEENIQPKNAVSILEPEREPDFVDEQPEKKTRGPNTDILSFMTKLNEHNKDWMNLNNEELANQMMEKTGLSKKSTKDKIKEARNNVGSFASGLSVGLPTGGIVGASEAVKKIKSLK